MIENESEFNFVLGNGKAPECIEIGVRQMGPYVYAQVSCIPVNEDQGSHGIAIVYSIQLKQFGKDIPTFKEDGL